MESEKCELCDDLFWVSEPGQKVCLTCIETPNEELNRQRAIEQELDYIAQRNAMPKRA